MSKRYDVTIAIPVYHAAPYIRKSLCSALSQTWPGIEFLLFDDGDDTGSMDIVRELQATHPRGGDIHLTGSPVNLGVGAARNRLIDEAQGDYIYFMDSDDIIEPNCIELLLNHQRASQADVVFGSYDKIELFDADRRTTRKQYAHSVFTDPDALPRYAFSRYGALQFSACNFIVRRSLLKECGLRFAEANYWEDMGFTLLLTTHVGRAVLLPDITYHYLCHLNSLSNYQQRDTISKSEITGNALTVSQLEANCRRLREKSYYPEVCLLLAKTYFYIACNAVENSAVVRPPFTAAELKALLHHPATLGETLRFDHLRLQNLALLLLARLPASCTRLLLRTYCQFKNKKK